MVDHFQGQGVVALAVNTRDSTQAIAEFYEKGKFTLTAVQNGNNAGRTYRVRATPTNYVIGKDGRVLFGTIGYNPRAIRLAISRAIAAK